MNIPEEYKDKAYFLDDMNDDIIVVVNRQSKRGLDRIVWSKREKKFIYGDYANYMVYHGEEDEPRFDIEEDTISIIRDGYNTGTTSCGSSFYDEDGKLYEVKDIGSEHELIFDINELPLYARQTMGELFG